MINRLFQLFIAIIVINIGILSCKKEESLPTVTTQPASNITDTSAQSGGNVASDGGATITACGICWSTSENPTLSDNYTINIRSTGSFTSKITGLSPGITYYVRAYATSSIGTAYGNQINFTTSARIPTVSTTGLSLITDISAQIVGNVTSDGGATITTCGVCWSTSENPTLSDSYTTDSCGTGSFTSNITGLSPGITYYVRAYATNNVGTSYGNELIFITDKIIISWQKSLGGSEDDYARSIQQTTDGGFIVAGATWSDDGDVTVNHGGEDYWIVKLSSTGEIDWEKSLGGNRRESAYSIQQTFDAGYIVAGSFGIDILFDGEEWINLGGDHWIVKLTSSGEIEWQRTFGETFTGLRSIQQTTDGGYITAGSSGNYDYYIVKLSSTGDNEWEKSLGEIGKYYAESIQQTADDGYIIAGYVWISHNYDYYIVKLISTGEVEWEKLLGGYLSDLAYSIQQTTDGGYIIAGGSRSNDGDVSVNHGGEDYWIVKLTSNGELDWQKSLGGSKNDVAFSIEQTTDGGFIVAGATWSDDGDVSVNHGGEDYWIVKLTSNGELDWQKSLGGSNSDGARYIQQTIDGGYIIAGYSYSNDGYVSGNHGGHDYWIVKIIEN